MRDKRFIAEHRDGPLRKAQHHQLLEWACACANHVLALLEDTDDGQLENVIRMARDWRKGLASVGDARKASLAAITLARELSNPTSIAVARSVGHAAATAHMADHSLGAALYALKAAKSAGKSVEEEEEWQDDQLPAEVKELVITAKEYRMGIQIRRLNSR